MIHQQDVLSGSLRVGRDIYTEENGLLGIMSSWIYKQIRQTLTTLVLCLLLGQRGFYFPWLTLSIYPLCKQKQNITVGKCFLSVYKEQHIKYNWILNTYVRLDTYTPSTWCKAFYCVQLSKHSLLNNFGLGKETMLFFTQWPQNELCYYWIWGKYPTLWQLIHEITALQVLRMVSGL